MGGVVDGHEAETQGILQLGTEQIPPEGRAHRARAKGAARTIKPPKRSEPFVGSEPRHGREPPPHGEPKSTREPGAASKHRPIDIPHDPTESQLHQSVAQLLDWILIEPAFYTTFPAGWGRLSKGTAGRLFASGLKKGMPDILVFDKDQKVIGIELKVGHNSVTAAQRTMFARLQAVGITVYVCRTQEDVLAALYRESFPCHRIHAGTNKQEPF